MIRGLYTSASGMLGEMKRTDIISNNLANVNTTGFKRDRAVFRAFPEMNLHRLDDPVQVGSRIMDPRPFIGVLGSGSVMDEVHTDFSQGHLIETSNPLDIVIKGEGFFQVMTPVGVRYTRDGSFNIDSVRALVTREGYRVQGENGPIILPSLGEVRVDSQGVVQVDGEILDRLSIVSFPEDALLEKQGGNLYSSDVAPQASDSEVIQGALEGSNLNVVSEMVDLIAAFRSYEASQKVLRANDETLGKAVNDIARI